MIIVERQTSTIEFWIYLIFLVTALFERLKEEIVDQRLHSKKKNVCAPI